jgi:hypothetical protein
MIGAGRLRQYLQQQASFVSLGRPGPITAPATADILQVPRAAPFTPN